MEKPLIPTSVLASADELDAKFTISIFASFVSMSLAFLYWYFRLGLRENSLEPILGSLFLGFFLFSIVPCVRFYETQFKVKLLKTQHDSDGLLLLIGLGVLLLFGMMSPVVNSVFYILAGFLGLIGFLVVLFYWLKSGHFVKNVSFILMAIFFGSWVATAAWGAHYQSPLYEEQLAAGVAHVDVLYHASIANMIKNFWTPSLGLNGNPYVGYHFGSHWIFAQLSKLTSIRVLQFYQLCIPVIFDSLQFLILLFLSLDLRRLLWKEQNYRPIRSDYLFWCFFLVFEMGFILAQRFTYPLFAKNHLMSESYNLAITISLMFVSLLLPILINFAKFKDKPNKITLFFVAPIGIALLCFLKISIGFIFMAVMGLFFLRLKLYRKIIFIASVALCGVVAIAIFLFTLPAAGGVGQYFVFFAYLTEYFGGRHLLFNLTVFFAAPLIYFLLRGWDLKIRNYGDFKNAVISLKILDVEFIFLVFIFGGVLPMVLMSNSDAHYFTDYNRWIALPFCLGFFGSDQFKGFYNRRRKPITLVLIILGIVTLNNLKQGLAVLPFKVASQGLQDHLDRDPRYRLVQSLQQLDRLVVSEKRETLLYIPKTNRVYWEMISNCRTVPFIAPATTGLAVLEGFPERGCMLQYTGMEKFSEESTADRLKLTPEEACKKTLSLHFSKLIYIDYDVKIGINQILFTCKDF